MKLLWRYLMWRRGIRKYKKRKGKVTRPHRQRPLIIHDERRIPDPYDHVIKDEVRPGPCGAEVLAAEAPGGKP
jgi:hypothetical protein